MEDFQLLLFGWMNEWNYSLFHFWGVGLKNENLMLQEKQMLRGWIPAGGTTLSLVLG